MTSEPRLAHRDYAGLISRVGAIVIDVFIVASAATVIRRLPTSLWESLLTLPAPPWLVSVAEVVAATVPWLYFTLSWWLTNRTIGALVVGVSVCRADGHELTFLHSAVRAAVGLALAPLWMIGLVSVLWDDRRRAWHDRLLRTVVRYTPTRR